MDEESVFGKFKVACECGSENVEIDNSIGFSETSGAWGSLDLHCVDCGKRHSLMEP